MLCLRYTCYKHRMMLLAVQRCAKMCKAAKATALIAAAFAGDVDTIAALVDGKASVEASTASGVTALQAAVEGAEIS